MNSEPEFCLLHNEDSDFHKDLLGKANDIIRQVLSTVSSSISDKLFFLLLSLFNSL